MSSHLAARPYSLVTEPGTLRFLTDSWRHERRLWLDTEVADWFTSSPRLSLLQVRDGSGRVFVVDVLDPVMQGIVQDEFVPKVMATTAVEKWAHYARFDQQFLGAERVANLRCSYRMARAIPYYRLPLRSLSLGALVEHFFRRRLDKTIQKADWGLRALSPVHLAYAAADVDWLYEVHDRLRKIPERPKASEDDPEAVQARYLETLLPLRKARVKRSAIREAVKETMIDKRLRRLSRFVLQTRTTHSTSLARLVMFASTKDPGGYFDLSMSLPERVRATFPSKSRIKIKAIADVRESRSFRAPRAPRASPRTPVYQVPVSDAARLTRDYEAAEHRALMLESERGELRERMKAWMRLHRRAMWGEFCFSEPRENWHIDMRLLRKVRLDPGVQVPFPQRLWLAFEEKDLKELIRAGQSRRAPVLRWLPKAVSIGREAQLSRDWHSIGDDEGPPDS